MEVQSSITPLSGLSSLGVTILVVMIILIILSAFFSMSETAFSSSSDAKLRVLIEERKAGAKKALSMTNNFDKTLIILLIGNNLVNVALSTLAVLFFSELIKSESVVSVVSTAVITIVLLIFGEIIPKIIAKQHPEAITVKVAWIIYILGIILTPFVYFFIGIQKMFTKKNNEEASAPDEEELGVLIDQMEDTGQIEHDEADTIRKVFDLNDRSVEDIMVPRIKMEAIDYNSKLDDVTNFMMESGYSRIPVYKGDKDHIVGILFERDFFPALVKNSKMSWKKLIRPVKFVAATMKVDALIEELQKAKTHIAIVSGEYGDTMGMVTMEDALEEIVGEIYDEHDTPGDNDLLFQDNNDGSYIVDGEYFVEDIFERLNIGDIPEDVPSKLSGWLFAKCESIPQVGFKFDYTAIYTRQSDEADEYIDYAKCLTFEINEVFNRRIISIKISVRDATEEEVEAHNNSIDE
ncbi:MAG: hemolysin family protein [Acholeplasmatales bacterium]|nr:hemolysin family protein [Acholeplasmatales bacterium]